MPTDNLIAPIGRTDEEGRWYTWSPRAEIAPRFGVDARGPGGAGPCLRMEGGANSACHGKWGQVITGVEAGRSYRFSVLLRAEGVRSAHENTGIKLVWRRAGGTVLDKDYINDCTPEGEWLRFEGVVTARPETADLDVELLFQWAPQGVVWWREARLEPCAPPERRTVRLATVHCFPRASTPEGNLEVFGRHLEEAGRQGADAVCLPEVFTWAGTSLTAAQAAEPVPGPATEFLGALARRHKMYVVASLSERDGPAVYNTGVLMDRHGNLAGKYRKTHLPPQEVEGGTTPGDTYPTFETDFARVGIAICYDIFFPELALSLALNGAEAIFLSVWGARVGDLWHPQLQTRASDNGVYLAVSTYYERGSCVISPRGEVMVDSRGAEGVWLAECEFIGRRAPRLKVWDWCQRWDWKDCYLRERRPETYREIVRSG